MLFTKDVRRIPDRGDLDWAPADVDRIAGHFHLMREAAVHGIEAKQMGVGLDGTEIVDGDNLDVGAAGFHDRPQDVAPDASKTVDRNLHCHR